jgi:hypothetical protein
MRKRCNRCGCFLDQGEWCDCEDHPEPEQEMARRPVARKPTVYPREYNPQSYIDRMWREFDMR